MNCEIIISPSSTQTSVGEVGISFQQDVCVNSTVSREICRGVQKEKRKKGVKYTKKRRFYGNQSVSRQSSVKQRRVESEASSTRVVDTSSSSSNDSGTDTETNVTPLKFQTRVTRSLLQRQNLSGCMAF